MPYNNPYNRSIANVVDGINERYAHLYAYSPVDGRGNPFALEGGSSAGVLFQMGNASKRDGEDNIVNDNLNLPPVYYYGNDSEGMKGGNGFAQGSFVDRGDGIQMGVGSGAPVGVFEKGSGIKGGNRAHCSDDMEGGNIFSDIYHGFEDLGSDIGSAVEYLNPFGSGHPPQHKDMKAKMLGRMLGKLMKHAHEGKGMSGGSWWSALKDGISDVVGFIPDLIVHGLGKKKAGRPKKMKGGAVAEEVERNVGGAILGNPDPYPVQGNSERVAGRGKITKKERDALKSVLEKHEPKKGRGRPRKQLVGDKQHDLLAMPSPVALENGVPPTAQLRGSYGGAKPIKEAVMKAVEKKLKGGMNLKGMTDKRAEMLPLVEGTVMPTGKGHKKNALEVAPKIEAKMGAGDGRKKRAEIVKRIMKEKGLKMIEASAYVKAHNLYKKD
jgi:hypothetical protein